MNNYEEIGGKKESVSEHYFELNLNNHIFQ